MVVASRQPLCAAGVHRFFFLASSRPSYVDLWTAVDATLWMNRLSAALLEASTRGARDSSHPGDLVSSFPYSALRLLALMDLYIHPLYVIVSKILSSILNSPAPIYPLYHPLSTLSIVGPTCHFI
jgi:hypothetical protein